MTNTYTSRLMNFAKKERSKSLEGIASLALTGSMFILFNQYMLNEMLHRYWA